MQVRRCLALVAQDINQLTEENFSGACLYAGRKVATLERSPLHWYSEWAAALSNNDQKRALHA